MSREVTCYWEEMTWTASQEGSGVDAADMGRSDGAELAWHGNAGHREDAARDTRDVGVCGGERITVSRMPTPGAVASALKGDRPIGRLLRPIANRLLPKHPIPVTVLSGPAKGLRLFIDTRNEKFFWTGAHEPEVLSALQRSSGQARCTGMWVPISDCTRCS